MTCDDLRERLLEGDLRDPELALHLSGCVACGELAAALIHAESDLRQHLEDFVNAPTSTLDAQWATALDRVGPAARPWASRVQRIVLVAAAAAVLALVAVPVLTPGPGGPAEPESPGGALGVGVAPAVIREARSRVEVFEGIDTEHLDVTGLDRAAEDTRMKDALTRKAQAMAEAEAALVAAAADGEPQWRATALGELGDLYAAMAEALARFPSPSYLTDAQRTVYKGAILAKVQVQRARALDTYGAGVTLARESGLDGLAADLETRAATTRRAVEAGGREQLRAVAAALRATLGEGCLDASARERGRGALVEIERAGDGAADKDLLPRVSAVAEELEDAVDRCRGR